MKHALLRWCCWLVLTFSSTAALHAQTVTGTITDADSGEPLIGVNILVKGTSSGAISDLDGRYSLTASPEDELIISYTGYKSQTITVGDQTVIDLELGGDASVLEEIVVVGYGTQQRKDLTGSVATLKGDAVTVAPTPDLQSNLAGKLAGVVTRQETGKPGADGGTFLIRGKSTFGNNNALVLVDGIERSIGRLDPADIESITVLKDAASAAIYGARAANGVVLVTTKRGQSGKPTISYNGFYGIQSAVNVPEVLDAPGFARYLNEANANSGEDPAYTPEQLAAYENGSRPSTDWWAAAFDKTAPITQHGVNVSGGTDIVKYFVSLGYLDQGGLHELSNFERYNARTNVDIQATDRLRVGFDISGRTEDIEDSSLGDLAFAHVLNAQPTFPAFVPDDIDPGGLSFNGVNVSPIGSALRSGSNQTNWNVFQGNLNLDYDLPVPGLTTRVRYGFDRSYRKFKQFKTPYTYYVTDLNNDIYTPFESLSNISLQQNTAEFTQKTIQASLNYKKQFGIHSVEALGLFEQVDDRREDLFGSRQGFISTGIDQLFAGATDGQQSNGGASESARRGYVGRLTYSLKDRYLFQVNGRYDGSYNFPKDSRWGFFPAVSVGWRISEEAFLAQSQTIDLLKLRASWGQFGNDRVAPFQYLAGYGFGLGSVIGGTYVPGLNPNVLPNPDITWETATSRNVGIDISLWEGRVYGEFDLFSKRTEDILITRNASIPATFGAALPRENLGITENNGFEISLSYRGKVGPLDFTISPNLTRARSEVIFIDEPEDVDERLRRQGRPFDQLFGLRSDGLFQTQDEVENWPEQDGRANQSLAPGDIKYVDINGDGVVDGNDITQIGRSTIPEITYGLNFDFSVRNFDLTMNWQGASGFDSYALFGSFDLGSNTIAARAEDAWRPDNPGAAYPRLTAGNTPNNVQRSDFWMFNGAYLKLRNVQLSYTLPGTLLKGIGMESLQVYVAGNNLVTISEYSFFDPERPVDTGGNPLYYPQLKRINFGLGARF